MRGKEHVEQTHWGGMAGKKNNQKLMIEQVSK